MQKNKTLKALLAISAVAAMFSSVGVQAQSAATGQSVGQTGTTSDGKANTSGKTVTDGTIDNTNSSGMENRNHAGMTGATGASGAGQTAAGGAVGGAKLSAGDEKALKDMAMADMAEVATGKMAQTKAQSPEVKAFGQQMIDDHGAALAKVQAVAQARGVTLPTDLDAKHKAVSAKLEKLNGEAFDKAYMASVGVKDHKDTHAKLVADAKKIKDPDVKALADQHLPVVEQHLKAAQQMASAKSGTSSGK